MLCRGVRLEQVEKFKYLVSIIDQTVDCNIQIRAKLVAAKSSLCSFSPLQERPCKTIKMNFLMVLVGLVYACETWTLKAADTKKLLVFEVMCNRRALWISLTAHRTNASVWKRWRQTQLVMTEETEAAVLRQHGKRPAPLQPHPRGQNRR